MSALTMAASAKSRFRIPVRQQSMVLLMGTFVALIVGFTIATPRFASRINATNILGDAAILMVLAVGATLILAVGDFDLSIGANLVFSGVIGAKVMLTLSGESVGLVITAGLLTCVVVGMVGGLLSGVLIAYGRIPSIIATLGVLGLLTGASNLITGGVDLRGLPNQLTSEVGNKILFGVLPLPTAVALVLAVVMAYVIRRTVFGRNALALGSNPESVRRAGVSTTRLRVAVFAVAGSLYGLAGFLSLAKFSTTTLAGHGDDMLQAYTAAILGGSSPFGGLVTVLGSVIGVFIPTILQNGFVIMGVNPFWQQVAVAVVLLAAVYLQRNRGRRD
jgi:ribose transport system permease protein